MEKTKIKDMSKDELREYKRSRYTAWVIKNKEHREEYIKQWKKENKDKYLEYQKKYQKKYGINKRKNNPELSRMIYEKYNKNNPKVKKYMRGWTKKFRENNKERIKFYELSQKIKIPTGKMCECCQKQAAKEKHHPDYSNYKKVIFLCIRCHKDLHKKLRGHHDT